MLPTDTVLELGCSFGDTTVELASRVARVRAADNSVACVERTVARVAALPAAVETHLLDVFGNVEQVLSLGAGCDAVFCDLGGSRALSAQYVALVLQLQAQLRPLLLVIKCRAMHAAAQRALGADGDGGVLPISSGRFWAELQATLSPPAPSSGITDAGEAMAPRSFPTAADEVASRPAVDDPSVLEVDAARVPEGETRLCFEYLNAGRCRHHAACTFRHLRPAHPDAIADARKRAAVGWRPSRLRGQKATVAAAQKCSAAAPPAEHADPGEAASCAVVAPPHPSHHGTRTSFVT